METPTPSRKALLNSFEGSGVIRPFFVLAVDIALFTGGLMLVLLAGIWLKVLGSVLMTAGIVRLFLIGHDA